MRYFAQRRLVVLAGVVALTFSSWSELKREATAEAQTQASAPASGATAAPSAPPTANEYVDFVGRTEAAQMIRVSPSMPGRLMKINFRDGQDVRPGDLLFQFDGRPHQVGVFCARRTEPVQTELTSAQADFEHQKAMERHRSRHPGPDRKGGHSGSSREGHGGGSQRQAGVRQIEP